MRSISASDYHKACRDIVHAALQRPEMFFKSLEELEAIMRGHETAFRQMTRFDRTEMLHEQFSKWLFDRFGLFCASGWAYAIEQQCNETGDNPLKMYERYINAFFDEWNEKVSR